MRHDVNFGLTPTIAAFQFHFSTQSYLRSYFTLIVWTTFVAGGVGRTRGKMAYLSGVICGSLLGSIKTIQEDHRLLAYIAIIVAVISSLRAGGGGVAWSYAADAYSGVRSVGFDASGDYLSLDYTGDENDFDDDDGENDHDVNNSENDDLELGVDNYLV